MHSILGSRTKPVVAVIVYQKLTLKVHKSNKNLQVYSRTRKVKIILFTRTRL